jgi:putative membrane protein
MIPGLILALILGLIAGTITGLLPGIHINLIAAILLSLLTYSIFQTISPIILVIFIVTMAITHTFLDFIPSIYLGAPEEDSFLSILPGHKLLQEGKGHEAVSLTLLGSLFSLIIILIFIPLFIFTLPPIYTATRTFLPFILIFASIYLIFREENFILSLTIFLMAGFLGYFSFNLNVEQPLLPLLSGLFGASTLIVSIKNNIKILLVKG